MLTQQDFFSLTLLDEPVYQFGDVKERITIAPGATENLIERLISLNILTENFTPISEPVSLPRYTESTIPEKNYISITDWKNHQVVKNDVYEIFLTVPWTVKYILQGVSFIVAPALSWMEVFKFDPKALFLNIMNKALNTATSIGLMKNKVEIDYDNSGFTRDYETMIVRVKILENAWPLYILIGVIALGTVFAVREVRLIYRGYPSKEGDSLFSGGLLLLLASVLFLFFILRK